MNALLIFEDFRKDQYAQPIVEALLADSGFRNANVAVCRDPLLRGVTEVLKHESIDLILARYPMVDLFLLLVDRDGNAGRRQALDALEEYVTRNLERGRRFLAENAWQEIEVWILAGHDLPNNDVWREVRQHAHPKERYFEPFAASLKLETTPGGGRKILAKAAASRFVRVRQLCREDLGRLRDRLIRLRDRLMVDRPA